MEKPGMLQSLGPEKGRYKVLNPNFHSELGTKLAQELKAPDPTAVIPSPQSLPSILLEEVQCSEI